MKPVTHRHVPVRAPRPASGPAPKPLAVLAAKPPNPLKGLEAEMDPERYAKEEMARLTAGYREAEKRQRESVAEANSAGYYTVLVFETESQCSEFLEKIGADPDERMHDGRAIAKLLKIELTPASWKPKRTRVDAAMAAMAADFPPE